MTLSLALLLLATLLVQWLWAHKDRRGYQLNLIVLVPAWLAYYLGNGDWLLCLLPIVHGGIAIRALTGAWAR
jgi:hypothetical protein